MNFDLISASFEEVQREILLLRSLRHENIIEYYTSFSHTVEDEEGNDVLLIWLVMQLMEYGALCFARISVLFLLLAAAARCVRVRVRVRVRVHVRVQMLLLLPCHCAMRLSSSPRCH